MASLKALCSLNAYQKMNNPYQPTILASLQWILKIFFAFKNTLAFQGGRNI